MAKLFSHSDLLAKHAQLRGVVSKISKETSAVRKEAKKLKEEAEGLFADLPTSARRNMTETHVKARMQKFIEPVREKVLPMLKEMESHRLELAEAKELMANPISYCNAVTIGSSKLLEQRAAAAVLVANMGPAALRVAAEAAKTSGDVGMIAALVDRNDQLPTGERPFSNAELIKDVTLPGFDDVKAVFAEVDLLPDYAMACSRAIDNRGEISANSRIEIGLSENKINIQEDGSLAAFQSTEAPRYKIDGTEYIQPDKPKGDDINPMDFSSFADFVEAGGDARTDLGNEVMEHWYGESGEAA